MSSLHKFVESHQILIIEANNGSIPHLIITEEYCVISNNGMAGPAQKPLLANELPWHAGAAMWRKPEDGAIAVVVH